MLKRPGALQSAAITNTDGTSPRQITNGMQGISGSLGWSPDGKSLLIYAGPVGARNIYRLDVETGTLTQLTNSGQWIVFNSLRNGGQVFIPRGETRLQAGDLLVVVAEGAARTEAQRLCSRPDGELSP